MDEEATPGVREEEKKGVPAWVMTFADLMTLLMCFFVLMLAFSEMDVQKFKVLSGSVREAFGVQAQVEVKTIPKGTSVIAREFSPGRPQPTPLNEIRQHTIDSARNTLDVGVDEPGVGDEEADNAKEDAEKLRRALAEEIEQGSVDVELDGRRIIIRILEKATFPSGDASIQPGFLPVLTKIRGLIGEMPGELKISGHTDDVPIYNERYRSNWELSTARAVSVAHTLLKGGDIAKNRIVVTGHADTRPLYPNDSAEHRAINRRVDISIIRNPSGGSEDRQLRIAEARQPDADAGGETGTSADGGEAAADAPGGDEDDE
ncbi:flagellar motor protein MotB [Lentisalinibacter salinarum]|uniref:flagellar motor protein MotB n=1 Tax=Lentisalinibacter salinarum TaxID=2992239 RepID=UPI00386C2DB8